MTRRRLLAIASLVLAALLPGQPGAAAPRPVELPEPELPPLVAPIPLTVARPILEPPPLPPLGPQVVDPGAPPLPRFNSTIQRPFPAGQDPGALSCGLAVIMGRGTNLARCGMSRALQGDLARAREALEESLTLEPTGPLSGAASLWLAEINARESLPERAELLYHAAIARGLPRELIPHATLGLGWGALRRGNLAAAQTALAQTLSSAAPASLLHSLARFLDGVARLLAGRAGEGLSPWDDLARSGATPDLALEALFWRGVAQVQRGEPEPAIRDLGRFLAAVPADHPLHAKALAQRGWAQLTRRAAHLALVDFLAAERAGPAGEPGIEVQTGLVRTYLTLRQFREARARVARLASAPESPLVLSSLRQVAEEALRRQALEEALETYRQLRGRPLDSGLRAYTTYRIAETLERLAETSGDAARRREAEQEYRRLREEGGDEGHAQHAVYRLALMLLRDRRPAEALLEGEALLAAGVIPELRARLLVLTAEAAVRARDPNRAATLLRAALREESPPFPAAVLRLALGWAHLDDRDAERALEEWQEAARIGQGEVRLAAYHALAKVALDRGHDARAIQAMRELTALAPSHPDAQLLALNRGLLLVRMRKYAAAIEELRPLLGQPASPDREAAIRRALGVAWYREGQYRPAQEMFLEAAQREPDVALNWLGAGLSAYRQKRLDDADRALMKARLATAPEIAIAAAYALVLVRRDDPREFDRRAGTFVTAYPTHPYCGVLVAKLVADALARGQSEQAHTWAKWLFRQLPGGNTVELTLMRLAEAEYAQPALARDIYHDVVARVRDRDAKLQARLGLAKVALALDRPAEAQQALGGFLREAPPDDPRLIWAFGQLARIYEADGQREQALATVEAFVSRFPGEPTVPAFQLKRGELLLQLRQWGPAREALEAARNAGEPAVAAWAHVRLGELHLARDNPQAAIEDYLGAAYVYPDSPPAGLGLQGAAQGYLGLKMPREARILLEKLATRPAVDPKLTQWAREELARLGPTPRSDPAGPPRAAATRP